MTSQEKTEECPFADIFNEDETERKFLLSKPVCFIIFGKPVSYSTYSLAFDFFLKNYYLRSYHIKTKASF